MNMIRQDGPSERLLARGRDLLRERRASEAVLLLERAASLPAATAEAHGLLAEALIETGAMEPALIAADAAIGLDPGSGPLRLLRARVRRVLGESVGAMDDAAAAVMADPADREAKTLLATCLSEAGQHDEAILLFHQVLLAEPEVPHRAAMLAMAFMRAGRHEAAEELYALAEGMAPYARGIVTLRAQNALLSGNAPHALRIIEAAIVRLPNDGSLHAMHGQALQRQGRVAEAGRAYGEAIRLDPQNDYLRHLAAATDPALPPPERAADRYLADVFDGYATRFERALFALGYRVPGVMLRMLEAHLPGLASGQAKLGDILDLGCGTGLIGATVHDLLGGRLVGVDIAPRMIEEARAKGIYTELRCAEISAALAADESSYEIVSMADVLCYFGPLGELLSAAARRLSPGGVLLVSAETHGDEAPWRLHPSGRYSHSVGHLREALTGAGLASLDLREETLRWESERPVAGVIALAVRTG